MGSQRGDARGDDEPSAEAPSSRRESVARREHVRQASTSLDRTERGRHRHGRVSEPRLNNTT